MSAPENSRQEELHAGWVRSDFATPDRGDHSAVTQHAFAWLLYATFAFGMAFAGLALYWCAAAFVGWMLRLPQGSSWWFTSRMVAFAIIVALLTVMPLARMIGFYTVTTIRYRVLDRIVALVHRDPLRPVVGHVASFVAGALLLGGSVALFLAFGLTPLLATSKISGIDPGAALGALASALPRLVFVTIPLAFVLSAALWHLADLIKDVRANRRPVALRLPTDIEQQADRVIRVAHLSDLHVTRSDDFPTMEYRTTPGSKAPDDETIGCTNPVLRSLIAQNAQPLREADVVVITGDVTDMGLAEEWACFESMIPDWLRGKLVLVPGNHDVNIVPSSSFMYVEPFNQYGRQVRMLRFLFAMDALCGERCLVWDWDRPVTLREKLAPHVDSWRIFLDTGRWTARAPVTVLFWNELFPMTLPVGDSGFAVTILDTNTASSSVITNAFGSVGRPQIGRLKCIGVPKHLRGYSFIYAIHHHVALPPELNAIRRLKRALQRFMVLSRGREVLEAVASGRPGVFVHGHRHVLYHGIADIPRDKWSTSIDVCSSASTTLGDERDGTGPGFQVWRIGSKDLATFVMGCDTYGTASFRSMATERLKSNQVTPRQ